jgi:hypothetical protein
MRKLIYTIGIVGVLGATFALGVFVGTPPTSVAAWVAEATQAEQPLTGTPFEMMAKSKKLPAENWPAF